MCENLTRTVLARLLRALRNRQRNLGACRQFRADLVALLDNPALLLLRLRRLGLADLAARLLQRALCLLERLAYELGNDARLRRRRRVHGRDLVRVATRGHWQRSRRRCRAARRRRAAGGRRVRAARGDAVERYDVVARAE